PGGDLPDSATTARPRAVAGAISAITSLRTAAVFPGPHDQRFQAAVLVSLAGRLADAEIELGVHGADLQAEEVKSGTEDRVLGLEDVIDVVVLVGGHVDVD